MACGIFKGMIVMYVVVELESVFLSVRKTSMRASFTTFDTIPRVHALINATRFYTPKVRRVTAKDEAALNRWLSWLSKDNKLVANLEMPNAQAPALPSVMQSVTTRKQKDRMMAKVLAESTRLISTVTSDAIHFPSSKTLPVSSTSKPSWEAVKNYATHARLTGPSSRRMKGQLKYLMTLLKLSETLKTPSTPCLKQRSGGWWGC